SREGYEIAKRCSNQIGESIHILWEYFQEFLVLVHAAVHVLAAKSVALLDEAGHVASRIGFLSVQHRPTMRKAASTIHVVVREQCLASCAKQYEPQRFRERAQRGALASQRVLEEIGPKHYVRGLFQKFSARRPRIHSEQPLSIGIDVRQVRMV